MAKEVLHLKDVCLLAILICVTTMFYTLRQTKCKNMPAMFYKERRYMKVCLATGLFSVVWLILLISYSHLTEPFCRVVVKHGTFRWIFVELILNVFNAGLKPLIYCYISPPFRYRLIDKLHLPWPSKVAPADQQDEIPDYSGRVHHIFRTTINELQLLNAFQQYQAGAMPHPIAMNHTTTASCVISLTKSPDSIAQSERTMVPIAEEPSRQRSKIYEEDDFAICIEPQITTHQTNDNNPQQKTGIQSQPDVIRSNSTYTFHRPLPKMSLTDTSTTDSMPQMPEVKTKVGDECDRKFSLGLPKEIIRIRRHSAGNRSNMSLTGASIKSNMSLDTPVETSVWASGQISPCICNMPNAVGYEDNGVEGTVFAFNTTIITNSRTTTPMTSPNIPKRMTYDARSPPLPLDSKFTWDIMLNGPSPQPVPYTDINIEPSYSDRHSPSIAGSTDITDDKSGVYLGSITRHAQ